MDYWRRLRALARGKETLPEATARNVLGLRSRLPFRALRNGPHCTGIETLEKLARALESPL